jgi:hypothetical protein
MVEPYRNLIRRKCLIRCLVLDPVTDVAQQACKLHSDTVSPAADVALWRSECSVAKPAHMVDERILKTCRIVGRLKERIPSKSGSGNALIGFGAGSRCADVFRAKTPSAAARSGFLVEEVAAVFSTASALPVRADGLAGKTSSATGGASSQRMIASRAGRNCFLSSAVMSSSILQASPIAVQSRWPFRIGGRLQ